MRYKRVLESIFVLPRMTCALNITMQQVGQAFYLGELLVPWRFVLTHWLPLFSFIKAIQALNSK